MKAVVFILALLMINSVHASEFSVRCEGRPPAGPYFATFDTAAKAVVFETAPLSETSLDGINVLAGDISNNDERADGRIKFTVRAPDGNLDLSYDTKKNRMIWPGIMAGDPFRPTLIHACETLPPRSILSFRSPVPILHAVTVRCNEAGYVYITMDPESKRALFDRGRNPPSYEGEVTAVRGDDIDLMMKFDHPNKILWNKSRQTITVNSNSGKPPQTLQCEETAPRTMIEYHKWLK